MTLTSQLKNIETHFTCPLKNEPLCDAVIVIPCMDKIQQTAAQQFLGRPAAGDFRVASGLQCPVCKKEAQGYLVDAKTSKFSQNLFGIVHLADRLAYPGTPSVFEHTKGNWEEFCPKMHLCRRLGFKSTNADALLKKFQLLGFINGEVRLYIKLDPSDVDVFIRFLKEAKVELNWSDHEKKGGVLPDGR